MRDGPHKNNFMRFEQLQNDFVEVVKHMQTLVGNEFAKTYMNMIKI